MEAVGCWRIIGVVGMLGMATPDEPSASIKGAVNVADPLGWRTYEEANGGGIYCRPARPFAIVFMRCVFLACRFRLETGG